MSKLQLRRIAPPVYGVLALLTLVYSSTGVFLFVAIVGAIIVGLIYRATTPALIADARTDEVP